MMKKLFLAVFFLLAGISVHAQQSTSVADALQQFVSEPIIGYLSYDEALKAMPQYALAQQQLNKLQTAFDEEMKRVEDEFNQKYESFLEGQKEFPRTILLKRQTELQELLQRNIDFKNQGREELKQAEAEALAPLRTILNDAIATVASQKRLILVVNTDSNACPFIDAQMGIDVTEDVKKQLVK